MILCKKFLNMYIVFISLILIWHPGAALGNEDGMIGIFTDHCRKVFAQGEEIEISVVVKTRYALHDNLKLQLEGPNLSLLLAGKMVHMTEGGSNTVSYRMRPDITALLKPATYLLKARLGAMESLPYSFQIVQINKTTHLVIYEANWSGTRDYGRDITSVPWAVLAQASLSHNIAMDLNNCWGNVYPALKNPLGIVDMKRDSVPEEWFQERDFMELASEELLRNEMGRIVQVHGVWSRTLRLGLEQNMRDYLHSYASSVQNWKRYPNFLGISYGDDLNTLGDWESGSPDAPHSDPHFQERMRFFIEDFAKRHPELNISRETLVPTNKNVWREWIDYVTELFPQASHIWHKALDVQMTNFITTHSDGISYFTNLAAGNYPPKNYRTMTVIQTKTESDVGTTPFQSELCAEFLSTAQQSQPLWIGSWGRACEGTTTILQRMVSLLGRNIDGVGSFDGMEFAMLSKNNDFDSHHFSLGRRERNKTAGELCMRYGDLCLGLNLDKDIALLYSYTQAMFDVNEASWRSVFRTSEFNFNPNTVLLNQKDIVKQAFIDFTRAGYTTRVVAEENILRGCLSEYKALAIVGLTHPLPSDIMARILEFQRGGGKVVVDVQTTIEIPGAIELGVKFNQAVYEAWKHMVKSFRAPVAEAIASHELVYKNGVPNWPVLKEKLNFIKPFVTKTDPRVLFTTQSWGKGKYIFVTHDTVPPGWDTKRFLAPNSQWLYPIQTELRLEPGTYTAYDIFSQREVPLRMANERVILPVDFSTVEGRIYALLPEPIISVTVKAPDKSVAGVRVPVETHVLGKDDKPIDALVSVEIIVRDPKGEVRYDVYRAAAGREGCSEEFLLGINDVPGNWTVLVKELFSGHWVQKTIKVEAVKWTQDKQSVFEVPEVAVFNLDAIKNFLRSGNEVKIALDAGQEIYRELADELCSRLTTKGLVCQIVSLEKIATRKSNLSWSYDRFERAFTDDLPDIECNVIFLQGSKSNRQLQALQRHGFCSRLLTPNYPGTGRGMIDYSWSPFSGGFDVITLAANGDTGLQKAFRQFIDIIDGKIIPEVAESQTMSQNLEYVRTQMLPPKIAWRPAIGTFEPKTATDELSSKYVMHGTEPEDFIAKRCGATIMALDSSPDGQYIIAGTNAFFNNLFLLNNSGKVLWTKKIGPIFVDKVAVSNDGVVIAANLVDGLVKVYTSNGDELSTLNIPAVPAIDWWLPNRYDPFVLLSNSSSLVLNNRYRVTCLGLDGQIRWEYHVPTGQKVFTLQSSSVDNMVTIGCWNEDAFTRKNEEPKGIEKMATIIRLNAVTGQEIWKVTGVTADSLWVTEDSRFTVSSGMADTTLLDEKGHILSKWPSAHVKAIVTTDGKTVFSSNCSGRTSIMEMNTNIFVTDTISGDVKTVPTEDVLGDFVLSRDGFVYAYSWDGHVYRINHAGTVTGTVDVGPGERLIVLPNGDLIAGSNAGYLTRFNGTGKIHWRLRLPAMDTLGK